LEDLKPVSGFVKEALEKRIFGPEEQSRDQDTLQRAKEMLEENKDYDVMFNVQGKQIPAHRDILSLRSSFFSNMFSSNSNEYFLAQ